jgi:predicted phage gp36 major capsid-like protein
LIADQQAELERLKQQLTQVPISPPADQTQFEPLVDEEALEKLRKEQQERLEAREKEIEQLRIQLEEQQNVPAIVVQDDEKADILAQKEKLLEEKEAQLQEQKRLMDEKVPEIEQVAMQLEALKTQVSNRAAA